MLRDAENQAQTLQSRAIAEHIEGMFERVFGKAKRPGPKATTGTVIPRNTERIVRQARTVAGHGKVIGSGGDKSGGIRIEFWDEAGAEIVRVDEQANRVYLNVAYEFISRIRDNPDAMTILTGTCWFQQRIQCEQYQQVLDFGQPHANPSKTEKFEWMLRMLLSDATIQKGGE